LITLGKEIFGMGRLMATGTTIQVFLPDGNPRSLKIAEITSRTVQAILIPRAKLDEAAQRPELKNVGIYFLVGASDEDSKPMLYIGEAEECLVRLKQQNKSKDFWNTAIAVVSKTQHFTKTHIKFLESYCYSEAEKANRFKLENSSVPAKSHVSEPMEADLMDNFETIKTLVATLGFPIFEQIKKPQKKDILYCKGKDAKAEGEYTEDGLIVFAGSTTTLDEVKSTTYAKKWREQLLKDGTLKKDGNVYRFTEDKIFSSPSKAAVVVLGRSANGWIEWKYKDGKTLDGEHRQSVRS
jgi:hypothetical protein